jgi:hypothetical protein
MYTLYSSFPYRKVFIVLCDASPRNGSKCFPHPEGHLKTSQRREGGDDVDGSREAEQIGDQCRLVAADECMWLLPK